MKRLTLPLLLLLSGCDNPLGGANKGSSIGYDFQNQNVAVLEYSDITATGTTIANGIASQTVRITLKDSAQMAVAGVTPTFVATDTDTTNIYGGCTKTNSSGEATCTLSSTRAETKTLSIKTPIEKSGGMATFINGPAAKVEFTRQPQGGVAGQTLAVQPIVSVLDTYDNVVKTGSDATATIALTLTSGSGALSGTLSRAAVAGVATFTNLSLDTAGSGQVLTATKANTTGTGGTVSRARTSNTFTTSAIFLMSVGALVLRPDPWEELPAAFSVWAQVNHSEILIIRSPAEGLRWWIDGERANPAVPSAAQTWGDLMRELPGAPTQIRYWERALTAHEILALWME